MILSLSSLNPANQPVNPKQQRGFTLIEIAIVLVIIGLLLGGLIMPLRTQRDINQRQATELQLQEIRAALIGFAQTNNRLPCPAAAGGLGVSAACIAANNRVPYATLGIQGTVINGDLVDVWQQPLRYTLANGLGAAITIALPVAPLSICTQTPCPNAANLITGVADAVVLSTGKDGADIPASVSPDQVMNRAAGSTSFVMRTPTEYQVTGVEFDDLVVWVAHPTLIYELGRAGRL
jgi:prepilin-type N-terminal cleavage/methylation domain-containing protein